MLLIEAFQGSLSLSEILNHEIPIINALRDAKVRYNNRLIKEREKQQKK